MPEHGEESLIDDMRAAIRADRERAAARLAKPPRGARAGPAADRARPTQETPPPPARSLLQRPVFAVL